MNRELLKQFENLFLELKKQTLNELKLEEKSMSWQKGDEVDQSLEERERALNLKLIGRHSFMLKKIDGALFKIKNGTFGICEECDNEIELMRLRARPVATQCITCKEEGERTEGQVLYEKRSHTLGHGLNSNIIPLRADREDNIIRLSAELY